MATFEIKMPKLGESITEGTIISWSVKTGDFIKEDDVLFEVSTAKVSAEIPSPVAGKVLEILFQEGDTVAVGTTVAVILLEGSEEEDAPDHKASEQKVEKGTTAAAPDGNSNTISSAPVPKAQAAQEDGRWYSPVVLQMAREANLSQEELDQIPGTGYMGRLSKKDMKDYLSGKKNTASGTQAQQPSQAVPASKPEPAPQSKAASTTPVTSAPSAPASAPSIPISANGEDKIVEMDRVGRIIADHMVMSKNVSPHVTTVVEVDVTKLVQWRSRTKDAFRKREGISLTYMPAITEATAKALAEFPQVNASVNGLSLIHI